MKADWERIWFSLCMYVFLHDVKLLGDRSRVHTKYGTILSFIDTCRVISRKVYCVNESSETYQSRVMCDTPRWA